MASKKKTVGIPLVVLSIIGGIAGGQYALDFSTTNIGQIGDNITNEVINNYVRDNFGVAPEKFKEDCEAGVHKDTPAQEYCDAI